MKKLPFFFFVRGIAARPVDSLYQILLSPTDGVNGRVTTWSIRGVDEKNKGTAGQPTESAHTDVTVVPTTDLGLPKSHVGRKEAGRTAPGMQPTARVQRSISGRVEEFVVW